MERILSHLLERYEERAFVLRLKARFIAYCYLMEFLVISTAIIYAGYAHLNDPLYGYALNFKVLGPLMCGLAVTTLGLVILVRGHYAVASHLLLMCGFITVWMIIVFERGHVVSRLDTIVLIIGMLSMTPIVILKRPLGIVFYGMTNILLLYTFMFLYREALNLPYASFISYLSDNTVTILAVTAISYQVYSINQRALEKAERDISERKKAEDALKETEQRLRAIFDLSFGFIGLLTPRGNIIEVNRTALEFVGAQLSDVIGKPFWETPWWSHSVEMQEQLRTAVRDAAGGEFVRFEATHPGVDGLFHIIDFSLKPVKDDTGMVILLIPEGRDITERKRAEEGLQAAMEELQASMEELETSNKELEESETQYRFISENTADVIWVLSLKTGKFTYVSPSVKKMLGYTPEEVMTQTLEDALTPESFQAAMRSIQHGIVKSKGDPSLYNHFVLADQLCKDGSVVPTEVSTTLFFDEKGQPSKIIGISRDITARKKAEEEKRILEERLKQADKMETIGKLAGGVAHDFNNLLMGIQGYATLALMNLDQTNPNYEMLKLIEEQVQSGADLTRQLLGFARGGRYEVKPADMNEIIEKTSSMFGRTKKEISIHRKQGKDIWSVEVDRGQMEQVFLNLFVNSWQAMPSGGEIYLETENVLLNDEQALHKSVAPGKYVKITVTDTGTGMDEKIMARIFDPFFTTKELRRGTGLGLATVNGIIKGHKGIIDVYSEPGHGSTFTIYLPASEREVVKEKAVTREITKGSETILLVDDEKTVLEVNRKLLECMGYRVYAAGSGQDAISIYMEKRNEIDLVVMDMIMPGISGAELLERLREINSNIKILITSGYSINGEAQIIMDSSRMGFLQKPFQMDQLSLKIREMLLS